MAVRSQAYWINRSNARMDKYILQAEEQADLIARAYYDATKYIESEMAKTIRGLAALSDDRTAIAALKKTTDKSVLEQLRNAVELMPEGPEKQQALTTLASPAYQFRMRRLQATIDNARTACENLYGVEFKNDTAHLRALYDDAFLHSVYDIDSGYNTLHTFSMFPASRVDKLLKTPWSGENYSERIWGRTQALAEELRTQMMVAFMTGATVSETSAAIRSRFESSAYAARRLVRTETNFIANQAELDSYARLGIEEYKYIATLDTRTSRLCQELDGQVFKTEDGKAGVNLPPMHPNCRSTTIMYDEEEPLKERIARDENGNRIYVPADMTYKEWLEKYHPELVDKADKGGIIKGRASGTHASFGKHSYEYLGTVDYSNSRDVEKEMLEFERENKDSEIEKCLVITAQNEKYVVYGDKWTVDTGLLESRMKGSINIHNHVTGESQYSFSLEDLVSSIADGSKTSIAFDEKYRYYMRFSGNKISEEEVYAAFEQSRYDVGDIRAYDSFYKRTTIPDEDEMHEIMKRTCERLGVEYERIKK